MGNGKRSFQRSKGTNPALQKALTEKKIENALHDARQSGINWAAIAYEVMTIMVLHDKFNITDKEELKRYCKEMASISDAVTGDYATLSDFVTTLKEEANFSITEDDLVNIDPALAGLLEEKE